MCPAASSEQAAMFDIGSEAALGDPQERVLHGLSKEGFPNNKFQDAKLGLLVSPVFRVGKGR